MRTGAAAYDVAQEGDFSDYYGRCVVRYALRRSGEAGDAAVAARASHERWLVSVPFVRLDSGPVVLEHGGRRYRGDNPAFGSFYYREEGWGRVGWVRQEGFLPDATVADLPGGWPLEVRVFALWLAEAAERMRRE